MSSFEDIFLSLSARIRIAANPAFLEPAFPIDIVGTGIPEGICTIDNNASKDERYKLATIGTYEGRFCILGAVSADGFIWKLIKKPLVSKYISDVQQIIRFDPEKGKYVGYFRGWTSHEHGTSHGQRLISYSETEDFSNWPTPTPLVKTSLHDSPDTDIYRDLQTNNRNLQYKGF